MKKGKVFFLLIGLVVLLNNAESLKLSLSPAHIYFSGKVNEEFCQSINLSSDKKIVFYGEDFWSSGYNPRGRMEGYNFRADQLNLEVKYPKQLNLDGKEEVEVCVMAKKAGDYYGVILYKSDFGVGAIGGLIEFRAFASNNFLTAGVINENASFSLTSFIIMNLFLLVLLLVLLLQKFYLIKLPQA